MDASDLRINIAILSATVAIAAVLFSPRVRRSEKWRATVTPLASIIGIGFLVVVPLLGRAEGVWAVPSMVVIVSIAYAIGGVLRHNIIRVEPALNEPGGVPSLEALERVSAIALAFAYLVSVTFYVRILSAFLLEGIGLDGLYVERMLTSGVLIFIGGVGILRGLKSLERLEALAVNAKLAFIGGRFLGLGMHDVATSNFCPSTVLPIEKLGIWEHFRLLAEMPLNVQGFETSRYLGAVYDGATRVQTMRNAQWISEAAYVLFVTLAIPLVPALPPTVDETAIIRLSSIAAVVLPPMLVFAAVMSQFSAAVADTVGGGGLIADVSRHRVDSRRAYAGIAFAAVCLNWFTDIFDIVAFASRAFAAYYALQCAEAFLVATSRKHRLAFAAMGCFLALVAVVAVPVA